MLFSGAEPLDLGLACRPNRSLVPRLLSGIPGSLLAPSPPTGLIVASILTASLASERTAALILTDDDRDAADHHQRDWEDSPHAMLDDREGPSHAMLKVWECHSDSGAFWRFRRANIRVHGDGTVNDCTECRRFRGLLFVCAPGDRVTAISMFNNHAGAEESNRRGVA